MPIDQPPALLALAALALGIIPVALAVAWFADRRRTEPEREQRVARAERQAPAAAADDAVGAATTVFDRAARVVALLFIATTGIVVAVSGAWPEAAPYIYVLLAAGTIFVVLTQDLFPAGVRAPVRYWTGAVGSIAFLALLTGLTGGATSPFALGWYLLVGGASLATRGIGPGLLALISGATWLAVSLIVGAIDGLTAAAAAQLVIALIALALLAYVGSIGGREQQRARDEALRLSRFDALTGLQNRAAFVAAVEREIRRVGRMGRGFCLLMIDLDDLKPVNDTYGHPAGDELLRSVTAVIERTIRATDCAGRYGGDEFMVLLPETEAPGALVVAEKLRREVSQLGMRVGERTLRTSISIGLVAFPDDGTTVEDLLASVDAAMYEAKRNGKNQIVGYATRTDRIATSIAPPRSLDDAPVEIAAADRPRAPRRAEDLFLSRPEPADGPAPERATGTWGERPARPGPTTVEAPGGRRYVVFPIEPDERRA
ncbi:MAG: GGDEF domain-containing protein [Chloroflexota bacterium]